MIQINFLKKSLVLSILLLRDFWVMGDFLAPAWEWKEHFCPFKGLYTLHKMSFCKTFPMIVK